MSNSKRKEQGFIEGSIVLFIATALVKVIGAIYKIPLNNILGELGAGYYTTAYDLYLPMYSLAMAGLPVAISRIVAECMASGRYRDVEQTLRVTKRAFLITGSVGFLLMCVVSYPFVYFTCENDMNALIPVLCIAPCLLFCCIMSTYRGYYEGLRNMTPTAISEVIEASGKLLFGLVLSYAVIKIRGDLTMTTLSLAAGAALLGIVLGSAFGALFLVIKYKKTPRPFTDEEYALAPEPKSSKATLKILLSVAIPIVLGSLVTNVTSLIDVVMVRMQLASAIDKDPALMAAMYAELIAKNVESDPNFTLANLPTALYGCHRSYAYSIYNLVPVLTAVLGVSAIPILATAWTKKDTVSVKVNMETMIKTTALIAMPAGLGIFALSEPILNLLYSSNPIAVAVAAKNLRILGISAIFAGLTAPMTNMLQAIGKQKIPLYNIAVGALIKIIVNFVLVGMPEVNIVGVPIGTTLCYLYIAVANLVCLVKYSGVKLNVMSTLVKPLFASALCGGSAAGVYLLGGNFIGSNKVLTVISIAVAAVVYILSVILFKILDKNDIFSMPKGEKLANILEKFGIIK